MELAILKKKLDGYRAGNGTIKNIAPELLLELRHAWENYTGSPVQFRSELEVKIGTLRKLLVESKKLNHVLASAGSVGLMSVDQDGNPMTDRQEHNCELSSGTLELVYEQGAKVIRFPSVELLLDFLKRAA